MSRIHEALKKAELERVAQTEGASEPIDLHAGSEARNSTSATAVLTQSRVDDVVPDGPLQFDDLQANCVRSQWHPNQNLNVFSDSQQKGGAGEQFRTLRSRLYQLRDSQPLRILLVTSPVPGDGKTFVTCNLAQAIVRQPDRRVLIVDGDLRASRLHIPLGAPKTPGLSDYLSGGLDETAVIQKGPIKDLFFIAGGTTPANPSELLSNGRLKVLFDRVAPVFDWVIIDSPPCLPVADARVIADVCDGVLLVIRAGFTPSPSAQKASQELQGKNVLGVVLNTVEDRTLSYSGYYGSAYAGSPNGSRVS